MLSSVDDLRVLIVAGDPLARAGLATLLAMDEDKPIASEYMAGSVNTNSVVIRCILGTLRKAGLAIAQPGAGGGSSLARCLEQITLLDVCRAVETGDLFSLHRRPPNPLYVRAQHPSCPGRGFQPG